MIKKLILAISFFIINYLTAQEATDSIVVDTQVNDPTEESSEERIVATVQKDIEELKELLSQLTTSEESDTLACFILRRNKVTISKDTTYVIDKLEIYIKNEYIEEARMFANDSLMFDLDGVVNLHQYGVYSKQTMLVSEDGDKIPLSDVLRYLPSIDNENYEIENQSLILTSQNKPRCISIGTDLNSFLDVRIYSDLLALLGKEGNGLVQTEISSTIRYNSFDIGFRHFIPLHYFRPYFNLSRFDSEFQSQEVTEILGQTDVNTTLFNQYAFATLGLDANLVRIHAFQHYLDLNIGIDHRFSDIARNGSEEVTTIQGTGFYGGLEFRLLKYKNFGMDLSFHAYYQRLWDNFILESDQDDLYGLSGMELFYHPNNDPSKSIFLRFNSMHNIDTQDYFTQLQFGYKTKLKFN